MKSTENFMQQISQNDNQQDAYLSVIKQEASALSDFLEENEEFVHHKVFERLAIPERIIEFKVSWMDDEGEFQINKGWRVQHSSLIGPYKGGLRFHADVNLDTLKALAYEQSFKNALTGLPIGGAKGGADFSPKGRSDAEIQRFCQAFMTELYRHIGPARDIPAGDINVGLREIGYLFGQYKRIVNQFEGAVTGKSRHFGGSHVRTEATGFGVIYFLKSLLKEQDQTLEGKTVCISGAGNVALHAAHKAIQEQAKVITLSNSRGLLINESGFTEEQINWLLDNQHKHENLLESAEQEFDVNYRSGSPAWQLACDIAIPCATQNELTLEHLEKLAESGCHVIVEGSNMALTTEALEAIKDKDIYFAPGKAANAGGVAISTLEMSQNATFSPLDYDAIDEQLQGIMQNIYQQCAEHAIERNGKPDLHSGASIAAFKTLGEAMIAQGV